MNPVVPLRALGRFDVGTAGGKGANLGELAVAGLPVPEGFVVTTAAFENAVETLRPRIRALLRDGDSAGVRAAIEASPISDALREAIAAEYAALGGGAVAVRSSATAEDRPGAAFAGLHDTYLGVVGEQAVIDAVRRCWASLWTDRAIAYRQRRGVDAARAVIAVVVQAMVDAEFAGVMFTADPVTGDRERFLVEAAAGPGEAVVSGEATPDRYILDLQGGIRAGRVGRREVVLPGTAAAGAAGTYGLRRAQPMPEAALRDLARFGTAVTQLFGGPQDIEWAYAAGRLWLLQARPMTALPPPPLRLTRAQRRIMAILLDYLPLRPYPIDMSTWVAHGPARDLAGEDLTAVSNAGKRSIACGSSWSTACLRCGSARTAVPGR